MFFDPTYMMFALPGLVLALWASMKTKTAFARYSRVMSSSGVSGAQASARLLSAAGVSGVKVEEVGGFLSDHYDPMSRTLRLSPSVYRSASLAAIGVACHEAGHAIQHARAYRWLTMRTALVPATNVSSWLSYAVIMLGFMLQSPSFILLGAVLFSAAVAFALITLPVEWDASKRAKALMVEAGIVSRQESRHAAAVLDAAFMTYVAAAVSSLLTLLYYLMRAGVFSRRDD